MATLKVKFEGDASVTEFTTVKEGSVSPYIQQGYITFTCTDNKRHFILLDKVEYFNY